jgi:hypothetical protein
VEAPPQPGRDVQPEAKRAKRGTLQTRVRLRDQEPHGEQGQRRDRVHKRGDRVIPLGSTEVGLVHKVEWTVGRLDGPRDGVLDRGGG